VSADRGERLEGEVGSGAVGEACRIADSRQAPTHAVAAFDAFLSRQGLSGLTLDLARRALARTASKQAGATQFASEFFGELTAYYAARDLPSFVGASGRVASSSEAVGLKQALRAVTSTIVSSVGRVAGDPERWPGFARAVLAALRGTEGR